MVERFGKETAKVRVLLASDVASEGLNLHFLCHRLVHFDVPWSLMVFAQRNGRIDRYGQERPPQIVYLLTDSKNEKIHGDVRILELLTDSRRSGAEEHRRPVGADGQYDEEKEVELTAQAIEAGESPRPSPPASPRRALSPLDLLLRGGPTLDEPPPPTPRRSRSRSSRPTSRTCARCSTCSHEARASTRTVRRGATASSRSQLPPDTEEARRQRLAGTDLRRRLRKLPIEVVPAGWRARPDARPPRACRTEIKLARREESAWPKVSYLWPLHPVVDWCNDKAVAHLGRIEAPVVSLLDGHRGTKPSCSCRRSSRIAAAKRSFRSGTRCASSGGAQGEAAALRNLGSSGQGRRRRASQPQPADRPALVRPRGYHPPWSLLAPR
jgi:hypothetical protein